MTRVRHIGHRDKDPLHQLTKELGTLDANLFQAIARSPSPLLDETMPKLTAAADYSKLWMGIGAGLILSGRPRWQRAAVRGLASLAVSSLVTNQGAKRIRQRKRPSPSVVPLVRRAAHQPLLVGVSRKTMIGQITGRPVGERLAGSLAAAVLAWANGASIVRVHDVAATVDAREILRALGPVAADGALAA